MTSELEIKRDVRPEFREAVPVRGTGTPWPGAGAPGAGLGCAAFLSIREKYFPSGMWAHGVIFRGVFLSAFLTFEFLLCVFGCYFSFSPSPASELPISEERNMTTQGLLRIQILMYVWSLETSSFSTVSGYTGQQSYAVPPAGGCVVLMKKATNVFVLLCM